MIPDNVTPLVTADFQLVSEHEWMTKLAITLVVIGIQCLLAYASERHWL